MSRTKGTYTLTSNIEPKVGAPLDARTIVKLLADLTASNTFEYPYKGMKVFVEENNKSYTLVGSDPTISSNWTEDGSGGGHVIKNQTGTDMNQRSNLQFVDMTLSDDAINDITKVENIHVIQSESELANLPDGLYMLDDDEDTIINGNLVGYDNTASGLNAENVQDAIDEIVETLDDKIDISTKGVANGVAELDSAGKVPSSQLPSFVDDVLEYASSSAFPATGETGKIYVALDTNKTYRWGGTEYVEISESLALGETSLTAYRGDRGKTAYDHSQITSGNPHNVTKSEVGLGNVDNTSDSTKKTNFTGSIASGNTGFVTGDDAYTALGNKADKVSGATNGNLAGLNGLGNLTDSGWNGAKDTTSISGNPISISGLKSNQLAVNPIITLEPIQAGSGTPSPSNVRAISGYDKIEVSSCGKNLCEETIIDATISVNGTITASGGSFDMHVARVLQGVTYTIKSDEAQSVSQQFVGGFFYSKPALNSVSYNGTRLANTSATFTSPITGYVAFRTSRGYAVAQCEYGSSQTTYVPYHKTTDLSESLGQTVYGGSLDVRTGLLTVDRAIVDMGTLSYTYYDTQNGNPVFRTTSITDRLSGAGLHPYICECYDSVVERGINDTVSNLNAYGTGTDIYVTDNRYSADNTGAAALKTALSGVKLCYKLATPFTIQLTPHEISLLKDYAYVSTNGTNIALDYHNGELASLSDVAQVGETLNELGEYVVKGIEGIKGITINVGSFTTDLTANTQKRITGAQITSGSLPQSRYDNCFYQVINSGSVLGNGIQIMVDANRLFLTSDVTTTGAKIKWMEILTP